jgi:uncharacterized protein YqgC (DUF456 family)
MDLSNWQGYLLPLAVQVVIIVGLVGLLIPVFPGLLIIWGATLAYGIIAGFNWWGWVLFAFITVVGLGASLADNVLMAGGAKTGGASWGSVIVAMVAGIVGTIVLPPFGGLLFAPVAVLLLEYFRLKDWRQAWTATIGMVKGYGVAFVLRFLGGVLMMVLWWIWVVIQW